MYRFLSAAALAAVFMWAAPASANVLDIVCEGTFQNHRLSRGVVAQRGAEPETARFTVDIANNTINAGGMTGVAAITPTQIIAIREHDPNTAVFWAIDRTNGSYLTIITSRDETRTSFAHTIGQCRAAADGATNF